MQTKQRPKTKMQDISSFLNATGRSNGVLYCDIDTLSNATIDAFQTFEKKYGRQPVEPMFRGCFATLEVIIEIWEEPE